MKVTDMPILEIALGAAALIPSAGGMYWVQRQQLARRQAAQKAEADRILKEAREKADKAVKEAASRAEASTKKKLDEELTDLQEAEETLRQEDILLNSKTSLLDKRANQVRKKEETAKERDQEVRGRQKSLEEARGQITQVEQDLSLKLAERLGTTPEEFIRETVSDKLEQAEMSAQRRYRSWEQDLSEKSEKIARKWMSQSIQRIGFKFVKETPTNYFQVENPKHIELLATSRFPEVFSEKTGVPTEWNMENHRLFFNLNHPYKKELAKRVMKVVSEQELHNAIADQPDRLDPILQKCETGLLKFMGDDTRRVIKLLGFKPNDFSQELQHYMGLFKFRFSFLQNIVDHSLEVAYLSAMLGDELGLDTKISKRAGYLHDLGKSIDYEVEGTHPQLGEELAKKLGEPEAVWMAAGHHHDDEPENVYAAIAKAADAISAARPGARKEKGDFFSDRLDGLARICRSREGVDGVAMMNAGREVRVQVNADRINDERAETLASELAEQIEDELTYPGQVKVIVIRETRASAVAH